MKLLFVACLVLIAVESGHSLLCYQCEGEPNGDCAKGVESAMELVECPNGSGSDYAMCLERDIRSGSERTYARGCTKWSNPSYCDLMYILSAQNPMALKVFSCNQCSTPKCNNGVE